MPALLSISQAAALAAHLQPGQQSVVPPARYSSLNASSSSEGLLLVGQTAVKVLHLQQPDIGCAGVGVGNSKENASPAEGAVSR